MLNLFLELKNKVLLVVPLHPFKVYMALQILIVMLTLFYFVLLNIDPLSKLFCFRLVISLDHIEFAAFDYHSLVSHSLIFRDLLYSSLPCIDSHLSFVERT